MKWKSKPRVVKRSVGNGDTITKKRLSTRGQGGRSLSAISRRWYQEPTESVFDHVFAYVRNIKGRQIRRRYNLTVFQQLYNDNFNDMRSMGLFTALSGIDSGADSVIANVIKQCVDTATSVVAKSKIRPFILPSRGDYRIKEQC